jgi:F420-0:gamma-glutamyl ligase
MKINKEKNRMQITGIKTDIIHANEKLSLAAFVGRYIRELRENSVVVFSSKIIGILEGRVIKVGDKTKEEVIMQEADLFLDRSYSKWGNMFTVCRRTLISASGIDQSNADGHYALWPRDPMRSAKELRDILVKKFKLRNVGVIISDSTVMPMRRGSVGIMIGWSGFAAVKDLRGEPDLFGRPMHITTAAVGSGLACAGNAVMGESTEQMPIAVITDIPFVEFYDRSFITGEEYEMAFIDLEEDLFAPFLTGVAWKKGGRHGTKTPLLSTEKTK